MSKLKGVVLRHYEREITELRANPDMASQYLKAAMESLDDPDDRASGLLALRTVAEAYGGLGAVAAEAGISRKVAVSCAVAKRQPDAEDLAGRPELVGMPVGGTRAPCPRLISNSSGDIFRRSKAADFGKALAFVQSSHHWRDGGIAHRRRMGGAN